MCVWLEFSPKRSILCFIEMVVFHYIMFKQFVSERTEHSGSDAVKLLGFNKMGFFF